MNWKWWIQRNLFVSAILLLASNSAAFSESKIFFHWGDVNGNTKLLQLGGYPYPNGSHVDELSHGDEAGINSQVMKQIRDWYQEANQRDVAGPGFYFSSSMVDSRQFGNDLLIVEIISDKSEKIETRSNIKATANTALESGDWTKVPLMSRYSGNWHILSREFSDAEKLNIRFIFRPPTAQDVDRIWNQMAAESLEKGLNFLGEISTELQNPLKRTPISRSSEILLHRLFFDKGFNFLISSFSSGSNEWIKSEINSTELLKTISGYVTILPSDKRSSTLITNYFAWKKEHSPRKTETFSSDEIKLLAQAFPKDAEFRKNYSTWVFDHLDLSRTAEHFSEYLLIYDAISQDSTSNTEPKMNRLKTKLKATLLGQESANISGPTVALVFKHLADDRASAVKIATAIGRHILDEYNELKSEQVQNLRTTYDRLSPVLEFLRSDMAALREVVGFLVKQDRQYMNEWVVLQAISEFIAASNDPNLEKAIASELRAGFELAVKSDPKRHGFQLRTWLEHDIPTERFEATVRIVARNFPELHSRIVEDLNEAYRHIKGREPVSFSKLIQEVKAMGKRDANQEAEIRIEELNESISFGPKIDLNPIRQQVVEGLKRSQEIVAGSLEYSEMARIFLLVDPLLVSEDLRTLDATLPQHRLNEDYNHQGKHYEQPAWQNFTDAWDFFSGRIWAKTTIPKNSFRLLLSIAQTHAKCMQAYVDGVPQAALGQMPEWNREKFETVVSNDTWNHLKLADKQKDLEKFFTIEEQPNQKVLRFKNLKQLEKVYPRGDFQFKYPSSEGLLTKIMEQVYKLNDPIDRAAKILHLMTKIHPFENGNGRIARLWAAMELVQAGYPIPVGLPTNDFFMDEAEIRLEVRKSIQLGRLWINMLKEAQVRNIKPNEFFQTQFRGSAMEGLLHVSGNTLDTERFVNWLERQESPPEWAKDFSKRIEAEIQTIRHSNSAVAKVTEVERHRRLSDAWQNFRGQRNLDMTASGPAIDCRVALSNLAIPPKPKQKGK